MALCHYFPLDDLRGATSNSKLIEKVGVPRQPELFRVLRPISEAQLNFTLDIGLGYWVCQFNLVSSKGFIIDKTKLKQTGMEEMIFNS